MSKSSGVIAARIVLAVVLLSLVVSCIYFFIIKARNDADDADNGIFSTYNSAIISQDIMNINTILGELESGSYYEYSQANNIQGFKEGYLLLHMSKQLLDANAFRLISTHGDSTAIQSQLTAVENSAKVLMRSMIVYNTSKESYGSNPSDEEKTALIKNFEMITTDLCEYADEYAKLASEIFSYTSVSYFSGVKPFSSAQYLYSYCLNKQIGLLGSKIKADSKNVSADLYTESKLISNKFYDVDKGGYQVQTTNSAVMNVISYCLNGTSFDDVLTAENKSEFFGTVTESTRKTQVSQLMIAIGLQGRLS